MKFGAMPVSEALGATVVHTIRKDGLVLKKGTRLGEKDIAALSKAGISEIVVARLEDGDVPEDQAAADIAALLGDDSVTVDRAFTGRCNLFAAEAGVLVADKEAIDAINRIDEAITVATLPAFKPVVAGEMIGTVKIIPFAVDAKPHAGAMAAAKAARPLMRVAPYLIKKIAIVSTLLPGLSDKVIDKTLKITRERIAPAGAEIISETRVPHREEDLTQAIADAYAAGAEMVIVFGASAIADRRDVIPAAIEAAGGRIEHFGMPVDPGNLMLIGQVGGKSILGAPGCARSPKENGFDWVLMRLLAGLPVAREDITGMGVGGLLMEIVTRPQPRAEPRKEDRRVAAVILAAGRSTRMGGPNKLLAEIGGRPLVRIAAQEALASEVRPVVVVTGHQREEVEGALKGLNVKFVHNPDFVEGLSTSLRAGLSALPQETDGALILLADMPHVDAALIGKLVAAFDPEKGALVIVPTIEGKRGNPVLWARRFFPDLMSVQGDVGARHLIGSFADAVREVALTGKAPLADIDTPDALIAARAELERQ